MLEVYKTFQEEIMATPVIAGEKTASVFIKKHKSILDLTLAIDMCENLNELAKLHTLNKDLMNDGITALFTSKKSKL